MLKLKLLLLFLVLMMTGCAATTVPPSALIPPRSYPAQFMGPLPNLTALKFSLPSPTTTTSPAPGGTGTKAAGSN